MREEDIKLAGFEELFRCPHCDFSAILGDPTMRVFTCQNPGCGKKTCTQCEEDWMDHVGIPCSEMEKMSEVNTRTCHRCKVGIMKSDRCHKMTKTKNDRSTSIGSKELARKRCAAFSSMH